MFESRGVPGLGDRLGGSGRFILHRADGSFAGLPGDEVHGFFGVSVYILLLFAEIIGKTGEADIVVATADRISPIGESNGSQDHRGFCERLAELNGREAGGSLKSSCFNSGAIRQDNVALFHDSVGCRLCLEHSILIVPLGIFKIKTGWANIAATDDTGRGAVEPWRFANKECLVGGFGDCFH